ncbi:MAG: hypothetical protein HZB26_20275 [Candidatus Hydrogenedentes bacterium]|nr:hypothetical protein [Candidatus Hydrogenedentota bacterium]
MTRRMLLGLVAVFAATQAAAHALGFRFETYPLRWFLHFLDPELLRTRLLESVFYMHIQPPLFNLFAGLVLKLTPTGTWLFYAIFLVTGGVFYIALVVLQLRLGVSKIVAVTIATLFLLSPSFLLYEHWMFYTFPCAAILSVSVLLVYEAARTPSRWPLPVLFTLLFVLCGMCSLFHLLYFLLVAALLFAFLPERRKAVVFAAVLPFVLLVSIYVKNWILFDTFSTSTVMGKDLWIMTAGNMNGVERTRLVQEGKLSPVSLINRFDTLDRYPKEYRETPGFEQIPALRQENKTDGAHNFNHIGQVPISRQYLTDAVYVLKRYPQAFVRTSALAWCTYFTSSELYVSENAPVVSRLGLSAFYDTVFYGKIPARLAVRLPGGGVGNSPCIFLLVGLPLIAFYAARCAVKGKAGANALTREQRIALAFCVLTIGYVAVIGNSFDVMETNRYRFMTDALSAACLGFFISRAALPKLRGRLSRRPNIQP